MLSLTNEGSRKMHPKVNFVYPYNAIFGRNTINKFAAVIHKGYLLMKIPTAAGVISVYGSQEEAR
jgi:hypothetical protein